MRYPRYIRNDAIIRAVQYYPGADIDGVLYHTINGELQPYVQTPRGILDVLPDDWIVISEHQISVCPPEYFAEVFRPVCRSTTDKP